MSPIPIATTAKLPVEYTPLPQDAAAFVAERQPNLQRMERELGALAAERKSQDARNNEGQPDALKRHQPKSDVEMELEAEIMAERQFIERKVEAIKARYPNPMIFTLKVPTSVEREQINSRLISLGLVQVTMEKMRATMIEEMFAHDWGKGSEEANLEAAEEAANFLDGVWQRQEAHDVAIARWQEQEVQRVLDEAAGAPPRKAADLPPKIIGVRDNARAILLIESLMSSSQRLRDLAGEQGNFNQKNALVLVRAHVIAATNVNVKLEQDPFTRALPEDQVQALREEMDDASWLDLVDHIDKMYRLDGSEVKNFDLPPERPSGPTGSPEPIADTATSDGSSTISSIGQAPGEGSATITDKSSSTTSDIAELPQSREANSSRTVEA